jgi:transposase
MSAPIKRMSTIKQILRLWIQGKSIKSIARSTLVSKNTVKKYLQLVQSMGLSVEALLEKEDPELERLLSGRGASGDRELTMLMSMIPELSRAIGEGINRWTLWGEYWAKRPSGYSYSRFCFHLQQYLDQQKATMHIEHQPGEHMYIDFTGKKLSVVDPETGEIREAEVFVSLLGYSQLTYVEAIYTQTLGDFIRATENALRYFGGSPRVVVCDNLKSAVKRASRFEPAINDSFNDFANHYQMVVLPARPYKPKDKALVENAVKIIYNRIFAVLRDRVFYSLSELNAAIRSCLEEHDRLLFQGRDESRRSRYESVEKHTLTPLPINGFELKKYLEVTVQKNCHIEVREDRHYYSVPHRYIGKKVRVVYTQSTVTIYFQGESVAFHLCSLCASAIPQ